MKIPLSNRLLTCCGFVKQGDRVADIGCDHGYLGIHLLKQGVARSVIAADVNEQPLQSAKGNADKFGVSNQMTFHLSDGVQNIPRDFDCMVCAGMGADTMISILEAAPWLKQDSYRLILQCQSKRPELRKWLHGAGFRINRETLAKDGKFVYTVMEVVYGAGDTPTPGQLFISPQLLADKHPLLSEYYERVKQGVQLVFYGTLPFDDPKMVFFRQVLEELTQMEEQIYGNNC